MEYIGKKLNVRNGAISPPNGNCNGYIKFRNFKEINNDNNGEKEIGQQQ